MRDLTVGALLGGGGRKQKGKNWDNCNRIVAGRDLVLLANVIQSY